ncbi:hypothetical protein [Candidatus Halobonum tyrrellensis]|uniref:hypothetical protein n=1 Tax=Candidatus Halobonum tyrrellensis TaxID=1431545 RepID=UPI001376E370|nr:hypothetical protein [Candidatus Halobonum tyrrellensis]
MNSLLDTIYALTSFGTLFFGIVALLAGVRTEIVSPVVLAGAVVVGFISIYWLLGG